VEANSDGSVDNPHGWPWTSVINAAHANGVKVILVATNFTPSSLLTLLTNETYKNNFFVNIREQMLLGSADGVNIDFEGTGSWRGYIDEFMAELTAYLHAEIPGCEVTFAGPAVNWSSAIDLPAVAAGCDGIFIMGYAFNGSWSTTTGPGAPLIGGSINITDTVVNQYAAVTQNQPEKLILGVPYYGLHWKTSSSAPRAPVTAWVGSPRFHTAEPESQTYGLLWDTQSQTPWYTWYDGVTWHQVWFDNAESLGLKYQLAQDHGLAGVGMWALNYDGTRDELWDQLNARFVAGCPPPVFGDFDGDGDVDLSDLAAFEDCMEGPSAAPSPTPPAVASDCVDSFDADLDADVDLADFAAFRLTPVADVRLEVRDSAGNVLPPPAYVESGAWASSTAKSTAAGLVGTGSRFITYALPNTGTDNATLIPRIQTPGLYEVFVTWGTGANCFDARYTIRHADGQATLLVDQIPEGAAGANANTWVSLGQYRFAAGQDIDAASLNVSEATVSGRPHPGWNQRVYADSAAWVFVTPALPP
jgi:hypothetical protein